MIYTAFSGTDYWRPILENKFILLHIFIKIVVYSIRLFSRNRPLKVHKRENFLGFDFEIRTFS